MRLILFLGSLKTGGAEAQAALLARGLGERGHEVLVLTLFPGGQFWEGLATARGVAVEALFAARAPSRLATVRQLWKAAGLLARRMATFSPDLVASSLYLTNRIAYEAWRKDRRQPLVWGIRGSDSPLWRDQWAPRWLCRRVAARVPAIVYNSWAGREVHLARGFPAAGARVIPNGIDLARFFPDRDRGHALRRELGVGPEQRLVGLVARLAPMKDHGSFLHAAAALRPRFPHARFVCVGDGAAAWRAKLVAETTRLDLGQVVTWMGAVPADAALYNAFDVAVSASAWGEGFSNSLGEALACGVPCVATASGDAARLVGEAGRVVEMRRPDALAEALAALLSMRDDERSALGALGRQRIEEQFSADRMVAATEALYLTLVAGPSA